MLRSPLDRPRLAGALALLALALGAAGCDLRPGLQGSGTIVAVERPAAAVHRISVSGGYLDVLVRVAPTPSLSIEGDDNLLEHVVTQTRGDRLQIGWAAGSYAPSRDVRVTVAVPGLEGLTASGAVHVRASGLDAARLEVDGSGACRIELAGRVDELELGASGASGLRAFELAARTARVDLSGACRVEVAATETLDVEASGASKLRYRGAPKLTTSTSGVAKVSPE